MLVLTRKSGQKIVVPRLDLNITVVAVTGNRVRLGISAPAGVAIHREEVWRRIGPQDHPYHDADCVPEVAPANSSATTESDQPAQKLHSV